MDKKPFSIGLVCFMTLFSLIVRAQEEIAVVSISPSAVQSPAIGEQLVLTIKVAGGENVAGYQCTLTFDATALRYVSGSNADYLPAGAFVVPPRVMGNEVTLAATSLSGGSEGTGTLATVTFEVIAVKASSLRLSRVRLTDSEANFLAVRAENGEVVGPAQITEQRSVDVNSDGVVNIQDLVSVAARFGRTEPAADVDGDGVVDIVDLVTVASAISVHPARLEQLTAADVQQWLTLARQVDRNDAGYQRGILVLAQFLAALTPKGTALLPNYPNPFIVETWIPYQLAESADATVSIYSAGGKLVRTLVLGHQPAGLYEIPHRAAYWNGKNAFGEPVANGVYFYTLRAGNFSATRNMVIRK